MTKKIEVQKTEVVSIKLRIKGKEIDLTLEDAKELKDALNKVFAEPVKEYVPYYPYIPYGPYIQPSPSPYYWWVTGTGGTSQKLPEIYCSPNTPYIPYVPCEPYKPYEPYIQPYWGDGTGNPPPKLPYIWCSPNTTSGTITVGDMPQTSYTAYKSIIDQFCNTYPTTETCGSMGPCVINTEAKDFGVVSHNGANILSGNGKELIITVGGK